MYKEFLSQLYTDKLCDKDFREWHRGIAYYGFWAVLIEDKQWGSHIVKIQDYLKDYFLPDYARQAHITLNTCGLLSDNFFSKALLDQQVQAIKCSAIKPFEICAQELNSFSTAAYLNVSSSNQSLEKLNTLLQNICSDSPAFSYLPHITLGLYRDHFSTQKLVQKFSEIDDNKLPNINIKAIQFCRYQTSKVQGPIEVIKNITL